MVPCSTGGVETATRSEHVHARPRPYPRRARRTGDPAGNERLTGGAAATLFALLAAEGVTVLFLRPLFPAHVFIGMLLIPPVALKLGSTGWRFVRYYGGDPEYRRSGPPLLPLRLLAPVVVASTLGVLATGVALLVIGPAGGIVLGLHKASFAVWLVATGIHVLAYVSRVPRLALADWRPARRGGALGGSRSRRAALAGALVAGAILAVATVQYAQPWTHWLATHHHHDG